MLVTIDELRERLATHRREGRKVALCHGCFDPIHPGHIKHFQAAKAMCEVLVVTVTPDRYIDKGPGRPAFDERTRAESIDALTCVDYVAVNEWPTAEETLRELRPDYYVKGQEFENTADITGKLQKEAEILKAIGAEMRFTHEAVFSSSHLLNTCFGMVSDDVVTFMDSLKRDDLGIDKALALLGRIRNLKILVIGDTIIDSYQYCRGIGKSPKSNVITVQRLDVEAGLGGALCVANHLGAFCDNVKILTVLGGQDGGEAFVRENLAANVTLLPLLDPTRPTTTKKRYLDKVFKQKLLEVHTIDDSPIGPELRRAALAQLEAELPEADLVIVGDFGHGFLHGELVDFLVARAPYLAVTVQTNSGNYGFNFATKYASCHYMALDKPELQLANHDRVTPAEDLARTFLASRQCRHLAVTLGRNGSMLVAADGSVNSAPIVLSSVVDAVGAGDAFLSLSAPLSFLAADPRLILLFGNVAGALAANVVGNSASIKESDFRNLLVRLFK